MPRSIAIIPTSRGSRYLQQLCKHWAHRFAVQFDHRHGEVELPLGRIDLAASGESLTVLCDVPKGNDIERLKQVLVDHLNRFAFREGELMFDWKEPAEQSQE